MDGGRDVAHKLWASLRVSREPREGVTAAPREWLRQPVEVLRLRVFTQIKHSLSSMWSRRQAWRTHLASCIDQH